jgi:hypothetical protein
LDLIDLIFEKKHNPQFANPAFYGQDLHMGISNQSSTYSGCQKNVPIFKRFFYNRTSAYAALPYLGTLLWKAV